MITFPKFKGKARKFAEPIYVLLTYTDYDFRAWFKVTGYNNNGELIGTSIHIDHNDNRFDIHNLTMKPKQDNEIHHYSLIDEETYLTTFNKIIEKLK